MNASEIRSQVTQVAARSGPEVALDTLRSLLKGQRSNADLYTLAGQLSIACNNLLDARGSFEKALLLEPKEPQFMQNLAVVLVKCQRPDLALVLVKKARATKPHDASLLKLAVECLTELGRSQDVAAVLEESIASGLSHPSAALDLARAQQEMGNRQNAAETFRHVWKAEPQLSGAIFGLARTSEDPAAEPALNWIDELLLGQNVPPKDVVRLLLSKGIRDDRLGNHDAAFAAFTKANELAFAGRRDARDLERTVDTLIENVDAEWFAKRAKWGNPSKRPVFVVGMPRSGTTLVEQILASHQDISGAGEIAFFRYQESLFTQRSLDKQTTKNLAGDYLALLKGFDRQSAHVVDKMPLNALRLWMIATAFPNATIIHCQRDPIATCVSIYTSGMGDQHGYLRRQQDLARFYLAYEKLMAHWHAVLPNKIHTVPYEALVKQPALETAKLIDAVGVAWDPSCLDFDKTRRSVRTPSRDQVSRPINDEGLTKWRRFEPFVSPLISSLQSGGIRTNS